jgi:hypothetical protein
VDSLVRNDGGCRHAARQASSSILVRDRACNRGRTSVVCHRRRPSSLEGNRLSQGHRERPPDDRMHVTNCKTRDLDAADRRLAEARAGVCFDNRRTLQPCTGWHEAHADLFVSRWSCFTQRADGRPRIGWRYRRASASPPRRHSTRAARPTQPTMTMTRMSHSSAPDP